MDSDTSVGLGKAGAGSGSGAKQAAAVEALKHDLDVAGAVLGLTMLSSVSHMFGGAIVCDSDASISYVKRSVSPKERWLCGLWHVWHIATWRGSLNVSGRACVLTGSTRWYSQQLTTVVTLSSH